MKKKLLILLILGIVQSGISQTNYGREWATYFGDSGLSIAGSAEFRGNLYLAGKAKNSQFVGTIINENSHQHPSGGGNWDGFIAKISPQGQLLWLSYYGGQDDDEIIDITADQNAVYVVGKTKSSEMATTGVHQTSLNGTADGFIASFDENGNRNWHTYFGGENEDEIISLTQRGNSIYLYGRTVSKTGIATAGSFQETITANGGSEQNYLNSFIAEFSKTGQRMWATYYGLATNDTILGTEHTPLTGIAVNETGLYVSGWDMGSASQTNTTYFGTPSAFLAIKPVAVTGIGMSLFVSKFSLQGSRLWSTYFSAYSSSGNPTSILAFSGGAGSIKSYHSITATSNGVFLSGRTLGAGITTPGVFQPQKTIGNSAYFIVHFSDIGERVWCSYLGNFSGNDSSGSNGGVQLNGLTHDSEGNIYISGATTQISDIATSNGYQLAKNAFTDCFVAKVSADGTTKMYGTYYGDNDSDTDGHLVPVGNGDSFYLIGTTSSFNNIATSGAWQDEFILSGEEIKNIFITKFAIDEDLSTTDVHKRKFAVYPNPNNGSFIFNTEDLLENATLQIFDIQGRKVHSQKVTNTETVVAVSNLAKGMYLVKLSSENTTVYSTKIIIEN